jgi:acyl carrier protein
MIESVLNIVSNMTSVERKHLSVDSSSENVTDWDSLNHMKIILAVEEEFGLSFTDTELGSLLSVRDIVNTIEGKK